MLCWKWHENFKTCIIAFPKEIVQKTIISLIVEALLVISLFSNLLWQLSSCSNRACIELFDETVLILSGLAKDDLIERANDLGE